MTQEQDRDDSNPCLNCLVEWEQIMGEEGPTLEEGDSLYFENIWTKRKYWETKDKTYMIYNKDGWLKLKDIRSLGESANDEI